MLLAVTQVGHGQSYQYFRLIDGVQATTTDRQAVLSLCDRYLNSPFQQQDQFWAPAELRRYHQGDLLLREPYLSPSIIYSRFSQRLVLSLAAQGPSQDQSATVRANTQAVSKGEWRAGGLLDNHICYFEKDKFLKVNDKRVNFNKQVCWSAALKPVADFGYSQ